MKTLRTAFAAITAIPSRPSHAQTKPQTPADSTLVYVGTYTDAKSKGIYLFRFQPPGEVSIDSTPVPIGLVAETPNPSFLELDVKRRLLFAVNETGEFQGKPTGGVSAFSIDSATGKLTMLNQRPSMGKDPCHLVLDRSGRNLVVANYSTGSAAALPVAPDGKLAAPTALTHHPGTTVHPQRHTT